MIMSRERGVQTESSCNNVYFKLRHSKCYRNVNRVYGGTILLLIHTNRQELHPMFYYYGGTKLLCAPGSGRENNIRPCDDISTNYILEFSSTVKNLKFNIINFKFSHVKCDNDWPTWHLVNHRAETERRPAVLCREIHGERDLDRWVRRRPTGGVRQRCAPSRCGDYNMPEHAEKCEFTTTASKPDSSQETANLRQDV